MAQSVLTDIMEKTEETRADITDVIGPKLFKRYHKYANPQKYELLRICHPSGKLSVAQVAKETGMSPKRLWRWLHSTRLSLEFAVLKQNPWRVGFLLQRGQDLREESCQLKSAEDYLKGVRHCLKSLKLPEMVAAYFYASSSLELGHVYRDQGGKNQRIRAIQCYKDAFREFRNLEDHVDRAWGDPNISCGWILAQQSILLMKKIQAEYQPQAKNSYFQSVSRSYDELLGELEHAPKGNFRYAERRAEAWQFLGEIATLGGNASEGIKFMNRACCSEAGAMGDHISRRRRRAETFLHLGEIDKAYADLQHAEIMLEGLKIEKGLHRIILDRTYCSLYRKSRNLDKLLSLSTDCIRSARRLGLKHEIDKINMQLS